MMMAPLRYLAPCMLLLAASSGAIADGNVYKFRLPDGRILYTQNRATRGTLQEVIRVPSPSPAQTAHARGELEQDRAMAQRLDTDRNRLAAAETHVRQAEQALNSADAALRQGIEPQPGERLATTNGNSRLNDAYWDRLLTLRQSVDVARRQLEMATSDYETARLAGAPTVETSGR